MKLPNWAKIGWWVILIAAGAAFVFYRRAAIVGGQGTAIDLFVVGVGTALLLAPLFVEMEFLGLKLKQQIEEAKKELDQKISSLRADMRSEMQSNLSSSVTVSNQLPAPVPDNKLDDLVVEVRAAIGEMQKVVAANGQKQDITVPVRVSDDVVFVFAVRYSIEVEVKRILDDTNLDSIRRRSLGVTRLLSQAVELELITPDVANAVKEVYAICSPAVHGEPVTEPQLKFLRSVAPDLLKTLRQVELRPFERTGNVYPTLTTR